MNDYVLVSVRTAVVFFLLLALTRIIGRKLLVNMTFFDYVTSILIGTISGTYVVYGIRGQAILFSPLLLTILVFFTSFLTIKSLWMRRLIEGEPLIVIKNGRVLEKNMLRARYNIDDLLTQLRENNVFRLSDVEFAVLEPEGRLSVLKRSQKQPLTPADTGRTTEYEGMSMELIKDGQILEDNLKKLGLSFNWLYSELSRRNVRSIDDVILASLETDGTLYIDLRDDEPEEGK